MKNSIAIAAFILGIGNCLAGSATGATIEYVMMDKNLAHSVFIKVSGPAIAKNACATNPEYDFVVYDDSQIGKNMLAVILTAHTSGLKINILGDNACQNETEKISRLTLVK